MSNLAVSKSGIIDIKNFNTNDFFFTDSTLVQNVKISDNNSQKFDFFFALFLLLLLSPVMLVTAALIKVFMKGDIFYSQVRVGRDGKLFNIIKFRTMIQNAEQKTGPVLATKNDPRITKLGSFLRASHLDELPQLFNVLRGEMSFVGPRPERPEFVEIYDREIEGYVRRKEVLPGITGLAQICLPYDATPQQKIQYDVYYIDNRNLAVFNVLIAFYTALKMASFIKYK